MYLREYPPPSFDTSVVALRISNPHFTAYSLAVQMRTIIGFENGGTNLGHLFHFAADQFSVAGVLPSVHRMTFEATSVHRMIMGSYSSNFKSIGVKVKNVKKSDFRPKSVNKSAGSRFALGLTPPSQQKSQHGCFLAKVNEVCTVSQPFHPRKESLFDDKCQSRAPSFPERESCSTEGGSPPTAQDH
ncbi:hypothetical protein LXL04_038242 [Taraxacum kok-saghyz]